MNTNGHVHTNESAREAQQQAQTHTDALISKLHETAAELRQNARDLGVSGDALHQIDATAARYERAALYLQGASTPEAEQAAPAAAPPPNNALALVATFVIGVLVGLLVDRVREE